MKIPEEIGNTARELGLSLRQMNFMRDYLAVVDELENNPEAGQLEDQLYSMYDELIARQQAGEMLSREETQAFYELRRQVQEHPLISKRDYLLRNLKPSLAEVADEISAQLGVDYTILARPA
jgi:cell fate (sporulation/competence/biofilm development) regulator YlbF (YheA/YmcA/DUF963 family)